VNKNSIPSLYVLYVIIENIANGLRLLHDKFNIVHNDIKPQNMLINPKSLFINYIDFGMACADNTDNCLKVVGSPNYCSPEKAQYFLTETTPSMEKSKKADVWAMAVTILYILMKKPLFNYVYPDKVGKLQAIDLLKIVVRVKQDQIDRVLEKISQVSSKHKLICEIIWPALQVDIYIPPGEKLHDINSKASRDLVDFVVNRKTNIRVIFHPMISSDTCDFPYNLYTLLC
jgi:serine/threonine protein kinase